MGSNILDFETADQGIEKLKEAVARRNRMCGALYWNIINDDCVKIANKLLGMGVPQAELNTILSK